MAISLARFFACLILSTSLLANIVQAVTHLHKDPRIPGKDFILRGTTFTDSQHGQLPHLVTFAVHLKKDTIIHKELEDAGVQIRSCSRSAPTRSASVTLAGNALDKSDYIAGAAFVSTVEGWEKNCGNVEHVDEIDDNDNTLFYLIDKVTDDGEVINLKMTIVPGSEVAPEVEVAISDNPVSKSAEWKKGILHGELLPREPLLRSAVNGGKSLPVASHAAVSFRKNVRLFDGADLVVSGAIGANVWGVRIRIFRKWKLRPRVTWNHSFMANTQALLIVKKHFEISRSGKIFKTGIPGASFGFSVWAVGHVDAGFFAKLDWILEANFRARLRAGFVLAHETRQSAAANLIPPDLSVQNLPSSGTYSDAFIQFTHQESAYAKVDGFVGVKPAIGVGISFRRFSAEIAVEIEGRHPPFPPFTRGRFIGPCRVCHLLRGDLFVKGKDLTGQIVKNGRLVKEKTFVSKLFEWRIATVCGIPRTCPRSVRFLGHKSAHLISSWWSRKGSN